MVSTWERNRKQVLFSLNQSQGDGIETNLDNVYTLLCITSDILTNCYYESFGILVCVMYIQRNFCVCVCDFFVDIYILLMFTFSYLLSFNRLSWKH